MSGLEKSRCLKRIPPKEHLFGAEKWRADTLFDATHLTPRGMRGREGASYNLGSLLTRNYEE